MRPTGCVSKNDVGDFSSLHNILKCSWRAALRPTICTTTVREPINRMITAPAVVYTRRKKYVRHEDGHYTGLIRRAFYVHSGGF